MAIKYSISPYSMIQYYNICGEDFNKEVAESLEKRGVEYNGEKFVTESISLLSPFNAKPAFFESTILIDQYMQNIMQTICELGHSDVKRTYSNAVFNILKTATSLNLLPEGSEDYMFHYARLDAVILETLGEISKMDVEGVINLSELISANAVDAIFLSGDSALTHFITLAMCRDNSFRDYNMFVKNAVVIDKKKLFKMAASAVRNKHSQDFEIYKEPFGRLSFQKTKSLL